MRDRSSDTVRKESTSPAAASRCPECGALLLHMNGCVLCGDCGYSPCD